LETEKIGFLLKYQRLATAGKRPLGRVFYCISDR